MACYSRISPHYLAFRHRDVMVVCRFRQWANDLALRMAYVWMLV